MFNLSSFVAGTIIGGGVVMLLAHQGGVPIQWAMEEFESQVQNGLNELGDRDSTGWGAEVGRAQEHIVQGVEMIRDGSRSAL
jgi:hypothetical protein